MEPVRSRRHLTELRRNALLGNALALMLSSAGTAILGVAFWGIAAHLAKESVVGRASAEGARRALRANRAQRSCGPIFERFLPGAGEKTARFIVRAYAMTLTAGIVLSISYIALGLGHSFLPTALHWRIFFVVSVLLWTIFILQDSALVGLRASRWIPVENILYALAKLGLLPLLISSMPDEGIFVAWMAPVVVTIIVVAYYTFTSRIPHNRATTELVDALPTTRRLVGLAGAQYTTVLTTIALSSVASLIVIDRIGATNNAYYFISAQIAVGPLLLADGVGRSFLVEMSREGHRSRHHSRVAIGALIALTIPSVIGGYFLAPWILGIFGHPYAVHSTSLLRMQLLALPASAVMVIYTAYAWYDQRVWRLVFRQVAMLVIFLSTLLLLVGRVGILAVGWATIVSSSLVAIVVLPAPIRRYRATD